MAEVDFSPQARQDLLQVLEYLDTVAGTATARKYDSKIKDLVQRLEMFPGLGTPRPRLGAETRMVLVDPYLVFYDGGPKSELVQVLRILHSHRDITPELIASGRRP
jgi:plasmid stabilization system protein ParE